MWSKCWLDDQVNDNGCSITVNADISSKVLSNITSELRTCKALAGFTVELSSDLTVATEGYRILRNGNSAGIFAASETGFLYGVFRLIALVRLKKDALDITEQPAHMLRMLNHWDNMDGSIERGYSGNSFFFKNNEIIIDTRTRDYARMLCSLGINGVVINNVNVKANACDLINEKYIYRVRQLSELFASYGIKMYLSLNYAASVDSLAGSADPLNDSVISFWKDKMSYIYSIIPELGGFLVKADSEGRPGPFTYGRTQADGANMLANAIRPYGGIIIWRCFVYNCQQDWRDTKTDRARSAYDYFAPLDGQFADNVILQIKNGPMDFQVREPVSPLFGGLKSTNQMIEFQIAQEYTGQQRHVCYLIPWFKEVLSFNTYLNNATIDDIVSGRATVGPLSGICAVSNTGDDYNWTGHDLAAANLYGFGRLCFDGTLKPEQIATEWIRLTYGDNELVVQNILKILMMSWPAYEKYTSPLGIGWMVTPNTHYGPDPDGYEYSRWGTYHKADHLGIGVDRSTNGTGYASLYLEPNRSIYNDPDLCPDELKLFFHHMPYSYILRSGKTILQHIYDTHFEGAEDVKYMAKLWQELEGLIEPDAFARVSERLAEQIAHSAEWRDVINSYFYRKTLISDEKGRALY